MSSEAPRPGRGRAATAVWLACAVVLFWGLRVVYWSSVEEMPFSDMGDFDAVARGIVADFDFKWSAFWRSYTTPSLVATRALQIAIFGDGLRPWQWVQSLIVFGGAAWLAWELFRLTGSRALALALLTLVAVSQPSIFWSLKLSREGFHEGVTYLSVAAALHAFRRPSLVAWFVLGLVLAVAFLNRPNAILVVPVVLVVGIGVLAARRRRRAEAAGASIVACVVAMAVGIAVLWGPWIVRSVRIYGEPVPLSTQAPYTFLWELGEVRVRLPDGTEVVTHVNTLQDNAARDFPDDLAASRHAATIARAWMREHAARLPAIMLGRIRASVVNREEYLTRVPRDRLFGTFVDRLLVDKRPWTVWLGSLGLLALCVLHSWRLLVLAAAALLPWLSAAALVPYARMLDASLPLILFGNVAWVVLVARLVRGRSLRGSAAAVSTSSTASGAAA